MGADAVPLAVVRNDPWYVPAATTMVAPGPAASAARAIVWKGWARVPGPLSSPFGDTASTRGACGDISGQPDGTSGGMSNAASDTATPKLITAETVGGAELRCVAYRPFVVRLNGWGGSR